MSDRIGPRAASDGSAQGGSAEGGGAPASIAGWVRDDPDLLAICAAAVDPLEITARLETHGVSSQVASDAFGYPDVFAAGRAVYQAVPFCAGPSLDHEPAPMGGPMDLFRGVLYAVPALMFTVAVRGFALTPRWWVLPVGLTTAWGTSQAVAVTAWSLRGHGERRSDALIALGSLVGTAAICLGCATALEDLAGGDASSVVVAVAVGTYIAAIGVLLFHHEEALLALCLIPAVAGTMLAQGFTGPVVSVRDASWSVIASGILVLAAVGRHLLQRCWRPPTVRPNDRRRAGLFLLYGLGCGLLTSVFIGFAAAADGRGGALVIAVCPLLLTLGLMEWHLRSFRGRAVLAMGSSDSLARFGHQVHVALLRSVGTYALTLAALSAIGIAIADARHAVMVPLLLAAVGSLGILFFLAQLVGSAGHIKLVLLAWAGAFAVLGTDLAVTYGVVGHIRPEDGITALLASSVLATAALGVTAGRVLTSPLQY